MEDLEKGTDEDLLKMLANIFIMFVAGFDTTSNLIAMCLYFLATNPECQNRVHDEVTKALMGKDILSWPLHPSQNPVIFMTSGKGRLQPPPANPGVPGLGFSLV